MDQEAKAQHEAKEELANDELKAQFAGSHAWHLVKQTLVAKVMEMDSISATIERLTKEGKPLHEIKEIMYTQGKAVNIIVDWMNEIETLGGNRRANFKGETEGKKKDEIIVQLPD